MACLVGIDYGTKRTGLACTDPNQLIASGLKNLPTSEVIPFLKAYCDQENVAGGDNFEQKSSKFVINCSFLRKSADLINDRTST